jgi:transposase
VDVLGLVLSCFVSAANVADVKAAAVVLVPVLDANARVEKVLADQSYQGRLAQLLPDGFDCALGQRLGKDFVPEPLRWIVERTFAWLENARRLCRDYQELPEHHESFIHLAMIWLMLRRLTGNQRQR